MAPIDRFLEPWVEAVKGQRAGRDDFDYPDYPVSEPETLACTSRPLSFEVGTGASIYTHSLLPAILSAKDEVILVTCFWAQSDTLTALRDTLEKLASVRRELALNGNAGDPDHAPLTPLKIRIRFSSRSLFQKLFHTTSRDGYTYPPSSWASRLGLPDQRTLEAGLIDLRVKSLFFLPFSVMHPKFLIVDRQKAWLPSCNVSWESWLEGCVELGGDAVAALFRFYRCVWDRHLAGDEAEMDSSRFRLDRADPKLLCPGKLGLTSIKSPASYFVATGDDTIPTVLLPSSHHRNPRFRLLPWQNAPSPPPTPLNYGILRLLEMAERSVYLQTPNLTSAAVMDALLDALKRGVNVTIVTSKGMMVLEQMLTAGTTTSRCLGALIRRYQGLLRGRSRCSGNGNGNGADGDSGTNLDLEAQPPRPGALEISYFRPLPENLARGVREEPVHSHLKLTIVDGQYVVLGSGNMDRASWFTSQELGILFHPSDLASAISDAVQEALHGRLDTVFSSR
ncbi:hypothetical protein GGR56DRAFT_125883 [Xylariaceae sp. FL0804]|nr:hypothetical protein GGR56DRAFT_125883 [Xylariaceae sp. FL0804]